MPLSPDRCQVCDSASFTLLFSGRDWLRGTDAAYRIVECTGCGLFLLDPRPSAEQLKAFRPESYWWEAVPFLEGALANRLRRWALRDQARFVEESVGGPEPVLDLSGSAAAALRERGLRVVAGGFSVPPPPSPTEADGFVAVRCYPPELCFLPSSFSAVTAFHVLEHLLDPDAALAELKDLLVPDGRLVVQAPNAESWQALLLAESWTGFDVPRHPISFRSWHLEALLESAGYEVLRRKDFTFHASPCGLATSVWPALDPAVRRARQLTESRFATFLKNALYSALVAAALPLAALEAASGFGATILVEARPLGKR